MGNLYHYNHLSNLTPQELFFWIAVDKMLEQVGGQDVVTAFAILAGQLIVPTRAKFGGSAKGTSIASIASRHLLNYDMKRRLPIITGASPLSLKVTLTKNLGAFIGRTVPIVGWAILGYDDIRIIQNTIFICNRLVKPEDRLSLK